MNESGHISFIDIEDDIDREELLEVYLDSPGVPLEGYKNAMEGKDMRQKFSGPMAQAASMWTSLIIEKFFESLPKNIELLKLAKSRLKEEQHSASEDL